MDGLRPYYGELSYCFEVKFILTYISSENINLNNSLWLRKTS
jgi:hypothetical protein